MSPEGKEKGRMKYFSMLMREDGPIAKLRRTAAIQKFSTLVLQMFTRPNESRK